MFFNESVEAASPRTPSQALPKMFQKPPSAGYYEMKKQDAIIPTIPEIKIKQQEDTELQLLQKL